MAMFDPLTGLYNRRFAEPRIEAEVNRCQRKGTALTLLLLDLDGFKQINDSHGHPAGDTVLRAFAEHITRAIRGSDLAARLGGDEFMLLLPECDANQLQHVLERLLNFKVEIGGKKMPVEFSAGWKEYQHGQNLQGIDRSRRPRPLREQARDAHPPAFPTGHGLVRSEAPLTIRLCTVAFATHCSPIVCR